MIWNSLFWFAVVFILSWLIGAVLLVLNKGKKLTFVSRLLPAIGVAALIAFVCILWIQLERPPMRTMAETRLWYALFVGLVSWLIFLKTKSIAMYLLGFIMSAVFLLVDIWHPEYQSKSLMPALQSPWFIPHVVVYMISYAVLAAASLSAMRALIFSYRKRPYADEFSLSLQLVFPGLGLLIIGLLLGAYWAKIAWGDYWSWDPKETWALLTVLFYLITVHLHKSYPQKSRLLLWMLAFSFIVLIITWLGIRYFPGGMQSVHVYGGS